MRNNRLCGMLGFAMRAGRLIIGAEKVFDALKKKGRILLVVYSSGASDATKKKIASQCEFYGAPKVMADISPEDLGNLLGKERPTVIVGVTDEGFAKEISKAATP